MGNNEHLKGLLAMGLTGFAWSLGGLFIKVLDWNPWAIAGGRSLLAALVLWMLLRRPRFTLRRSQVLGALSYSLCMILFVFANKNTTAANAILLQYTAPLFTAVFGALWLGEKVRWHHWGAFALSGTGLWLLLSPGSGGHWTGDLMALASGIAFSLTFLFGRKQKEGSGESLVLAHGVTAFVGLVAAAFLPLPEITWPALGALAVLGIVQLGLASWLFSYGLKRVTALSANLAAVVEPVFNPLWVFLVMGEAPGPLALAGGLLIILGVTGSSLISWKQGGSFPSQGSS